MRPSPFISVIILALIVSPAGADEKEERPAIMQVIETFFSSMTAKDVDTMQSIMTENGLLHGYRETTDGIEFFNLTHSDYLANLASREGVLVERIWDPEVHVLERLASVWTPYDFYSDGNFVHCGVNHFSLYKTDVGWKITGVVFSVRPEGCEPSPLGPFPAGPPE